VGNGVRDVAGTVVAGVPVGDAWSDDSLSGADAPVRGFATCAARNDEQRSEKAQLANLHSLSGQADQAVGVDCAVHLDSDAAGPARRVEARPVAVRRVGLRRCPGGDIKHRRARGQGLQPGPSRFRCTVVASIQKVTVWPAGPAVRQLWWRTWRRSGRPYARSARAAGVQLVLPTGEVRPGRSVEDVALGAGLLDPRSRLRCASRVRGGSNRRAAYATPRPKAAD
jgi:hypothetical protein